jgi:hypothetical protein
MYFSAIVNTARPERCALLTTEEAARLAVEGWVVGDSVALSGGPWEFAANDRLTTADVTEERLCTRISRELSRRPERIPSS